MGSFGDGASWDELVAGIHQHYEQAHDSVPEDVETGATLASGTTIGGNSAFHQGNDGSGSGLTADTLRGKTVNSNIYVQSAQPASPSENDVWIKTDEV